MRGLAETEGFFTRKEALSAGYDDRSLARSLRGGTLHRVRRGYYTFSDLWTVLDDSERHRVRAHAVLRSVGSGACLSHVSAALEHGIPVWGLPLDRVHVTRLDGGAGRVEGDVVHHEGFCTDSDLTEVDGRLVTIPARCTIEAVSRATGEVALALFDAMLRLGLASHDALQERFTLMQHWPHLRHLHVPVRMADGRSESIGESRGRWLFWAHGLPAPDLQFQVRDASGVLRGTCDWGWVEHGLLGEFDGKVKYGRLLKPGQTAGDVVFAEKQREDQLREISGMRMVRLVWEDYQRPRLTVDRVERLLRRAS